MAITQSDGSIILSTKVDTSGINKGMTSIKSAVSKVSGLLLTAFGVKQLINFGKEAINLASDLEEVQNVVNTAFGSMSYKIEEFSKTAIEQFGISELSAKKTASTYMAMGKGMGIAEETASDMAITLTGLTADMASFYNISQERADVILKSIYTGETETLKQLGIVMTEVNLEQFALSQGITKSLDAMNQQEKTMLRYKYVLKQTALVQGDFAKTSNSWANQTRILTERFKEMQTTWGVTLKSISTLFLPIVNTLIDNMTKLGNLFRDITNYVYKIFTGEDIVIEDVASSSESASEGVDNLGNSIETAAKKAKKALAPFDDLQILYSNTAKMSSDASSNIDSGINSPTVNNTTSTNAVTGKIDDFSEILDNLMDTASTALTAIGLMLLAFGQIGWGIGFIVAGASTWGVIQYKNGNLDIEQIKGIINDIVKWLDTAMLAIGLILLMLGQMGWGIGFIIFGAVTMAIKENKDADLKNGEDLKNDIKDILSDLKKYLEASMLAIGVILIFLGQYALGLGFIISAYASISVTGDNENITNNVKDFISENAQIITGISISLLVIGLILIASGFCNYFTVGLLAAGAIGLKFAAMSTDQSESDLIKQFVDKTAPYILGVSTALLVIGALLVCTKIGLKIGLSMVAAGAAGIFTALSSDSSELEKMIIGELGHIFSALGTALFVLGVVLLFVPGMWGYGLALMAVGVVGIASSLSFDWETLPTLLTDRLNELTKRISRYAFGIGVILLFVPGMWGYGLALMAAGVIGMFTANTFLTYDNNTLYDEVEGRLSEIEQMAEDKVNDINGILGNIGNTGNVDIAVSSTRSWASYSVPKLATGAVIPPNREFLAMLGDQKNGTNIEAPLSTIEEAVSRVIDAKGGAGGSTTVVLELDGIELGRTITRLNNSESRRTGTSMFTKRVALA